jgi:hypothetical protein
MEIVQENALGIYTGRCSRQSGNIATSRGAVRIFAGKKSYDIMFQ